MWECGEHMTPRKQTILTVVKQAIKDVETIKRDIKRDSKPYWKFDVLNEELQVVASQVESLANEVMRSAQEIDKLENTRDALIVRNKNLRKKVKNEKKSTN